MLFNLSIFDKPKRLPTAGLSALRSYLLPPLCLSCETQVAREGAICGTCWSQVRQIEQPFCAATGSPFTHDLGEDVLSADAIANPPVFNRARSVVLYDDIPQRLIQSLKFSDRTDLAPWLARWMTNWVQRTEPSLISPQTLIIPVPLHSRRLLVRRFNQSAELARHIAKLTKTRYKPELLQRIKATKQQVGLGTKERARNVQGAFRVPSEAAPVIKGAHVLLIDDVYTTGATLTACTRSLRRAGAANVDCLTFARVARDGV